MFGLDDFLIAAAISAVGAGVTGAVNSRNNKRNADSVAANNSRIEERQDNALQRARADAELAGFSPWTVAGSNGASSGGTVASTSDVSASANALSQIVPNAFQGEAMAQARESLKQNKLLNTEQILTSKSNRVAQSIQNKINEHNLQMAKQWNLPVGATPSVSSSLGGIVNSGINGFSSLFDKITAPTPDIVGDILDDQIKSASVAGRSVPSNSFSEGNMKHDPYVRTLENYKLWYQNAKPEDKPYIEKAWEYIVRRNYMKGMRSGGNGFRKYIEMNPDFMLLYPGYKWKGNYDFLPKKDKDKK